MASPDFLETLSLTARVVDGLLAPGTASVQVRLADAEATAAPAGLLSLRLYAGRLMGEASRMGDELAASVRGPVRRHVRGSCGIDGERERPRSSADATRGRR